MLALLCGCDGAKDDALAFSPTSEAIRTNDRIARCATVHSVTLPAAIRDRYEIDAGQDTAIVSCSLQVEGGGPPQNIPAQVTGTATRLTGNTSTLDFKEILDEGAVSYLASFSIESASEIDFDVKLTDPQTGDTYVVAFRQTELPGRK